MYGMLNENALLDAVKEDLQNNIKAVTISELTEPLQETEAQNEFGDLFIKSMGIVPSQEVATNALGFGLKDMVFTIQIVILMPPGESERNIIDLSYELRRVMRDLNLNAYIDNFNDGFKLVNAQPVYHEPGIHQVKSMLFSTAIVEEL